MSASFLVIGFICFLSVVWGIFGSHYFLSTYGLGGVAEILPSDMSYVLFAVILPILFLMMIALIFYVVSGINQNKQYMTLLLQSIKSQMSGIQTIGKSLIEVRKLGFTNQFFINLPIVFNDISQFVANIISRMGIASEVVIYDALSKEGDTRLYSICKIILDKRESTPHFDESLRRLVKRDEVLSGMIGLFIEKYDNLLNIVNKYDVDHFVVRILEEGDLGKVYNILSNARVDKQEVVKNESDEENGAEENISLLDTDLHIFPSDK